MSDETGLSVGGGGIAVQAGGVVSVAANGVSVLRPANHDLSKEMTKSRSFIPLLRLLADTALPVKAKKVEANHFGLGTGDNIKDLGAQVVVVLVGYRHAASAHIQGPADTKKKFRSNYDATSEIFKQRKAFADSADPKVKKGYFWGYDFLVWVPSEKVFAILPLNNPTNRNRFSDFDSRLGTTALVGSEPLKNDDYAWNGITITGYAGVVDPEMLYTAADLQAATAKFQMTGETEAESPDGESSEGGAAPAAKTGTTASRG